jgi:transposase
VFIRQKKQRTGTISVQIIDKSSGKSRVIKTIGSSKDPFEVAKLVNEAKTWISEYGGQTVIDFMSVDDAHFLKVINQSIQQIQLLGPELILGRIFDEVGFGSIKEELFRYLVISRLVFPGSKLRTMDYLAKYQGVVIDVERVYRYLDKLQKSQMKLIQQISYEHTLKILGNEIGMVFYDVTTLYFEAEREDDLRRIGYSKEGKHRHPQILLGLLVGLHGYPLAYQIFEGNKFEGHTLLPVIEQFKKQYSLEKLVIVADAGLLSKKNIDLLITEGYEFILGGRIKNESESIKKKIKSLALDNGESSIVVLPNKLKLVISYSDKRAKKDKFNRTRGLNKLEKSLKSGKLTKQQVNNRGYNKYLALEGELKVTIDYEKFEADAAWDGLKGFVTNSSLSKEAVIDNYRHLWLIEKAFRISKTDLKVRPIFHRLKRRIEGHICIAFYAYKIYKELERQLEEKAIDLSPEKTIEILKTIYGLDLILPKSGKPKTMLLVKRQEQATLLDAFDIPWDNNS